MTGLDVGVLISYFLLVTLVGFIGGRGTKSTHDFFFAGRRFGWFTIAMSCVATVVGSYSFVKYSGVAYNHGFAATQNYLNDWMWVALLVGGWIPILWISGVSSVPEYFYRRFGKRVRNVVTVLLLLYMVGYIGINFRTLGKVLHTLSPLMDDAPSSEFLWAAIIAVLCAVYVTAGGQTSVITTDVFQGALLLIAGVVLLVLGFIALGPEGGFLENFPQGHRAAFTPLTKPPDFAAVGLFWQDGFSNSAAFYFVNQGLALRLLSARSAKHARKAMVGVVLILMPIAAIAVCGAGWVGRAMNEAGILPASRGTDQVFVEVTSALTSPGWFGLIMAALTAALMSTADTLINAVASVTVNDIWRPYVRPGREDAYYLKVARWASLATAAVGIGLVPVFMGFKSIFDAHGMFTAAITPPLVVALLMGMIWKRYTSAAALATLLGGTALIVLSMVLPDLISPFDHGVDPAGEGARAYKYMRAFFGVVACAGLGVAVTFFTKARKTSDLKNLVVTEIDREAARS